MKILVFDTETTGLAKSKTVSKSTTHLWPYVVQFSYIIYDTDTNKITKVYDKIIKLKPYNVISPESTKLHGITHEISESQGILLIEALSEFAIDIDFIDFIVMHNVDFDLSVIKIELLRMIETCHYNNSKSNTMELSTTHTNLNNMLSKIQGLHNLQCTMRASIDLCKIERENSRGKYYKFPTLSELHIKLFDVEPKHLHNSLHDILITLRCFVKMSYNLDIIQLDEEVKELLINII